MILEFIISMFATLAFAVLFAAPKSELIFCGLAGAIGWSTYLLCLNFNASTAIANLIATFMLTIISRTVATVRKSPATVYLITGIFPLVPGAGLYYTSYYLITNEMDQFSQTGTETLKVAGAIVLGIIFGFVPPQAWFHAVSRRRQATRD